jgi:phosphatidylserine/phosphatidylglycerophosphate/cardiolipin synthase-like enzyme
LDETGYYSPMLRQETTEVLYGNENIQRRVLEAFSRVKEGLDGCTDPTDMALNVRFESIWNGFVQLKKRGLRLRSITEVTPDNISYVKQIMELFEVRHLKGIRSNFAIIDKRECLIHSISHEEQPLSHAIVSNSKALVEAQQYLYETLWSKAISAEKKVKEIQEGIVPEFIDTLSDKDEINTILRSLLKSTMRELLVILPTANTLFRFENEGVVQILEEEAKRGIKVRMLIPSHTTDNDNFAKQEKIIIEELIKDPIIEVQHLDKLSNTKMITIVSDSKLSLTIEVKNDNAKTTNEAIGLATHSNSESTVLTSVSIFETLWAQAHVKTH